MIDWFRYCRFVPCDAQNKINERLANLHRDVRQVLAELNLPEVTVAISGSLARQEPSVTLDAGDYVLHSDLDLVLVTPDDDPGHPVHKVVPSLRERNPDLQTTGFVVRGDRLPHMRSFVGADLVLAWESKLGGPAHDTPCPVVHRITVEDHLELFVHQLNGWLLYPHNEAQFVGARHYRPSPSTHLLKCLLEGLRLVMAVEHGPVQRYVDLLDEAAPATLSQYVPQDDVAALVRSREIYQPGLVPPVDTDAILLWAVAAYLATPVGDATALLDALADHLPTGHDTLAVFRHCVLLLIVAHSRRELQARATRQLEVALDQWPAQDGAELANAMNVVRSRLHAGTADLGDPTFVGGWITLREEYYRQLGDHNFGRIPTVQ